MSRSIFWLRHAGLSLGQGAGSAVPGRPLASASFSSIPARARVACAASVQMAQAPVARPFSAQRAARKGAQTSRFKKSGVSLEDSPPGAVIEEVPLGADANTTSVPEFAPALNPAPAPRPTRPAAPIRPIARVQTPPQGQNPVDTSSKEYKRTEGRIIRLLVALPFLIVTSYFLYGRRKCMPAWLAPAIVVNRQHAVGEHLSQLGPEAKPEPPEQRS